MIKATSYQKTKTNSLKRKRNNTTFKDMLFLYLFKRPLRKRNNNVIKIAIKTAIKTKHINKMKWETRHHLSPFESSLSSSEASIRLRQHELWPPEPLVRQAVEKNRSMGRWVKQGCRWVFFAFSLWHFCLGYWLGFRRSLVLLDLFGFWICSLCIFVLFCWTDVLFGFGDVSDVRGRFPQEKDRCKREITVEAKWHGSKRPSRKGAFEKLW